MKSVHAALDTVIILTTRMEKLAEFYRTGLNLPPPQKYGDDHTGFQLSSVYIGFDQVETAANPGPVSLWFAVDDLEAVFKQFVEKGAKIKVFPVKKPWGDVLAAVFDPDGNVVGLVQRRN
ncbi:MAG: VOC family protein [Candidatus Methanofastidiosia archaeon]|jgi:predicted enzyme related to lactoylglutathione lyase